ncbi:hypothetical protein Cni_G19308 [Canna indica]|uniref:Trehalose-phosphatase n=1 Tax=Canna indica TaxID=4628 RepID=A0AAQ3KM72_9LILI|nr:hypothetical protein Cni_G19308 [Canna indica]
MEWTYIMCPVRKNGCTVSTEKQGAEVHLLQPAHEFLPIINEVFRSLLDITKDIEGAKVEYNKFSVSVHYCLVDQEGYPRFRVIHGRKVLEIRPMINWNKGKAVKFLLESLGLRNCDDVLSIFIGDDKIDEDAFKAYIQFKYI